MQISSDRSGARRPIPLPEGAAVTHATPATPLAVRPLTNTTARDARLRSMVDGHFDVIWRALKRLGVPDGGVDDAAQQVLLVAARRLDEIRPDGERAYLLGVALRVAADARRALGRRREVPIDELPEAAFEAATPEELIDEKRARARLAALLDSMPDEMRECFVLFELEDLSAPEIAALLSIPPGTVASRVRRAREHIRLRLARDRTRP
jgi:RNA polymerase sigma-70 factor (ECF subfamily)